MAELIKTTDSLNDGRKKLNDAITDSNAALSTANTAKQTANLAKAESESTQTQLDTIVIEGDSSVEAAQARVNNSGTAFPTLKQRLDAEHQEVTAQLQQKVGGGVKLEPEDLSASALGLITGEGGPFNILSEPQDFSVGLLKLDTELRNVFKRVGKNLFDPRKAQYGKLRHYSGVLQDTELYSASGLQGNVEPNKTYTISVPATEGAFDGVLRLFDKYGDFIGLSNTFSTYTKYPHITQTDDYPVSKDGRRQWTISFNQYSEVRFIEISMINNVAHTTDDFNRVKNSFMIEEGQQSTSFEPYDVLNRVMIADGALPETQQGKSYNGVLWGKKLGTAGDSITENIGYISYGAVVSERNNMTYQNYGIGGSTLSNVAGKNPFTERWQNMDDDLDYLTIWFGWNDNAYSTLGSIDSTDNTTYYGAWNTILPNLIAKYPTTKIGLIVPYLPSGSTDWQEAVRLIGKKYGIPCLDLTDKNTPLIWLREGVDPLVAFLRRDTFTYDTTHLNQVGINYFSTFYEEFLRSL